MTTEQKELYIKIKNNIEKGSFDSALELCDGYAAEYPDDVNGWLYYLLAYCKVKSTKELVNVDINIQDTPVYNNALANLDSNGCEKLKSLADSIARVRKKQEGNPKYNGCMKYFAQRINELKADIDSLTQAKEESIRNDKENFKQIKKSCTALYANNLIYFLMLSFLILLPFIFLYVLFLSISKAVVLQIAPLVIGLILVVIVSIKKLKKRNSFAKQIATCKENGNVYAVEILSLWKEICEKTARRKQLVKIYKVLKKHPKLNTKSIEKLWAKFDKIYNGV